jgi:DNA-3-methyladenine glycosylase
VDKQLNGMDLFSSANGLWVEAGKQVPDDMVNATPRIVIDSVPEPWRSIPWRYVVRAGQDFWNRA